MLFSSITFLYYFLPCILIIYFLLPTKYKNGILAIRLPIILLLWGAYLCISYDRNYYISLYTWDFNREVFKI